jgi:hypothetical protein
VIVLQNKIACHLSASFSFFIVFSSLGEKRVCVCVCVLYLFMYVHVHYYYLLKSAVSDPVESNFILSHAIDEGILFWFLVFQCLRSNTEPCTC